MTVKTGFALAFGLCVIAAAATPASARAITVHVDHFRSGGTVPTKYSFCAPTATGHMGAGPDINPGISWSRGPRGTKSYAILLTDTDSPAEHREMMNKEGMTLGAAVKRKTFYHWVLVDIPPSVRSIAEGAVANGRVPHGRAAMPSPVGTPGRNDYTGVFAGNDAMKGNYFGYDGPCPPWNDGLRHHYHFTVYALSVAKLDLAGNFDGAAALAAMQGKILAQGTETGVYTTNPAKGAKVPKM
jgi:Raf kinase inhibitor-like YbhB/YbcL family protein